MGPARFEPQASEPAQRAQLHARPLAPEVTARALVNHPHVAALWRGIARELGPRGGPRSPLAPRL